MFIRYYTTLLYQGDSNVKKKKIKWVERMVGERKGSAIELMEAI